MILSSALHNAGEVTYPRVSKTITDKEVNISGNSGMFPFENVFWTILIELWIIKVDS